MPRLLHASFLLGLCSITAAAAFGADTKDEKKVEIVDAPAATKDDLAVRMTSPAKFAEGDMLKIAFKFTNIGKEGSFAIYNKFFDNMYSDNIDFDNQVKIVAYNRDTKESFTVVCLAEISRAKGNFPTVILGPGQSWEGKADFGRYLRFRHETGGNPSAHLPPGNYRTTVTWKFPQVPGSKVRWWAGEIESKPIEFEIVKATK